MFCQGLATPPVTPERNNVNTELQQTGVIANQVEGGEECGQEKAQRAKKVSMILSIRS